MAGLRSGVARFRGRDQCQLHGKVRFATLDPKGSSLVNSIFNVVYEVWERTHWFYPCNLGSLGREV